METQTLSTYQLVAAGLEQLQVQFRGIGTVLDVNGPISPNELGGPCLRKHLGGWRLGLLEWYIRLRGSIHRILDPRTFVLVSITGFVDDVEPPRR